MYKRKKIILSSDSLTTIIYARRKCSNIFSILSESTCELRILYPTKLAFKYEAHKLLAICQGLREYCFHELVLSNLLKNNLTKMMWAISSWVLVVGLPVELRMSIKEGKYIVCSGCVIWECGHGTTIEKGENYGSMGKLLFKKS